MQKFCSKCGQPISDTSKFCKHCGNVVANTVQPNYSNTNNAYQTGNKALPAKSKVSAGLLALLIGGWGIHKFYLGETGMGVLYLILWWFVGFSWILALIDGIMLLTMSDEKFCEKYNCRIG